MRNLLKLLLPTAIFILIFFFYFSPVLFDLSSKTLGPFGDKMGLISVLERGEPIFFNQPALGAFVSLLSRFLAPFAVYNITVLLSFPLTCFFAYKFLARFFDHWLAFVLALVFTFSPYHIYKSYNHVDLAQVWVFPFCFSALLDFDKERNLKRTLELGGLLALTTLISNYYGYFMLIITALFFLIQLFQSFGKNVPPHFSARGYLLLTIFYLLLTAPLLLPYLKANYLGEVPTRGISDFAALTARPWYFVTPSVYHPIFGRFAEGVHDWFRRTGYFLCDDFFAQEHSGIFLGWTSLILATYAVVRFLKKRGGYFWTFFWLMLALIILSGPPFFTISGLKIYLPSYLLMKAFPMFRTLARLGVPILLCLLVLVGFALESIKKKFSLILIVYLILALFEFYNPPTIVDVPKRGSVEYNQLLDR